MSADSGLTSRLTRVSGIIGLPILTDPLSWQTKSGIKWAQAFLEVMYFGFRIRVSIGGRGRISLRGLFRGKG